MSTRSGVTFEPGKYRDALKSQEFPSLEPSLRIAHESVAKNPVATILWSSDPSAKRGAF
jgi:hypothetical protein